MVFFLLPANPCECIFIYLYIYIYIYIYNIESVLLKSISMIIYIYQGMMALGKGGESIMGELRRGNAGRGGGWGKKCKKKLGSNKCSKGGTNRIFTNVSHLQRGTDDIGGYQNPISSLVSLPQFFPPPRILMPHGSLPHVSWTHATLHPGVDGYWPMCLWPQLPNLRSHCH
jgi:hypothetical protein